MYKFYDLFIINIYIKRARTGRILVAFQNIYDSATHVQCVPTSCAIVNENSFKYNTLFYIFVFLTPNFGTTKAYN